MKFKLHEKLCPFYICLLGAFVLTVRRWFHDV